MWLFLLACQMFYYSDEEVSEIQLTQVADSWNVGIQRSISSAVKILVSTEGRIVGHGSGNLFYYHNQLFIITAAHVVDDDDFNYLIQESNGNVLSCRTIYKDIGNDIAIVKPYGKFMVTQSSPYYTSMQKDLTAKEMYYAGNPGDLEHIALRGWVAESDHHRIVLQSFAWPGSSGSVVFDMAGRAIGVVSAIPIVHNFWDGGMMPLSQIVMVRRLEVLPRKTIREALKNEKRRIESRNSD
jgi:S1-C subfamily serine protease